MSVLLVGTLDTKGTEFAYVRDRLRAAGVPVLVARRRRAGPARVRAGHSARRRVRRGRGACRAGESRRRPRPGGGTGRRGCREARGRPSQQGKLSGVMGLGGSAGTTIATAAMRALPVGVPKLMVSTLASGQVQHYVGTRDVMMMYSVVDIAGLNRISRAVLDNAAAAMVGMVHARTTPRPLPEGGGARLRHGPAPSSGRGPGGGSSPDKPVIAATMFGVTTPCVEAARKRARSGRVRGAGVPRDRHRRADDGRADPRRTDRRRARHHHDRTRGRTRAAASSPPGRTA